jgi:hypothetical protein
MQRYRFTSEMVACSRCTPCLALVHRQLCMFGPHLDNIVAEPLSARAASRGGICGQLQPRTSYHPDQMSGRIFAPPEKRPDGPKPGSVHQSKPAHPSPAHDPYSDRSGLRPS